VCPLAKDIGEGANEQGDILDGMEAGDESDDADSGIGPAEFGGDFPASDRSLIGCRIDAVVDDLNALGGEAVDSDHRLACRPGDGHEGVTERVKASADHDAPGCAEIRKQPAMSGQYQAGSAGKRKGER